MALAPDPPLTPPASPHPGLSSSSSPSTIPAVEFPMKSRTYGGGLVYWTWRCLNCGRISYLSHPGARVHTLCSHCHHHPSAAHLASETVVNRALRAPEEFLHPRSECTFGRSGCPNRLSHPIGTICQLAQDWANTHYHLGAQQLRSLISGGGDVTFEGIKAFAPYGNDGTVYWNDLRVHL